MAVETQLQWVDSVPVRTVATERHVDGQIDANIKRSIEGPLLDALMHIGIRQTDTGVEYAAIIDQGLRGADMYDVLMQAAPNKLPFSIQAAAADWRMPEETTHESERLRELHERTFGNLWRVFLQSRGLLLQALTAKAKREVDGHSTFCTFYYRPEDIRDEIIQGRKQSHTSADDTAMLRAMQNDPNVADRFAIAHRRWLRKNAKRPNNRAFDGWSDFLRASLLTVCRKDPALRACMQRWENGDIVNGLEEEVRQKIEELDLMEFSADTLDTPVLVKRDHFASELGQQILGFVQGGATHTRHDWDMGYTIVNHREAKEIGARTKAISPQNNNMVMPLMRWTREGRKNRAWMYEPLDAESAPATFAQSQRERMDSLFGLTTVASLTPSLVAQWPQYMSMQKGGRQQGIHPAQVPLLAIMREKELLGTPLIQAIEERALEAIEQR